jgi:hypothetical protein
MKEIKLSHSGKNKYKTCPKSFELRYVNKLVPRLKGSALYFGSAIDAALNHMLVHKDQKTVVEQSLAIFNAEWFKQKDNKYDLVELPKCEDVAYFKSDFDPLLLTNEDWKKLPKNILSIRENVESRKRDLGWYNLESSERQYYNHSCWLSLRRKGELFIKAYYEQIVPKIKRTLAVQLELEMEDGDGAKITGFIDAVVEILDGRVIILDNKTSSQDYGPDSVSTSDQLALYRTILNMNAENPKHAWMAHIDACGYAVLSKKLNKITHKECKKCGNKTTSTHTKCNNGKGKNRCNGEWTKTYEFTVDTQFIVDNIPEMLEDQVLEEADTVVDAIKSGQFDRNLDACMGKYGRCEYYLFCHENSMTELIDIKDRKKNE